MGGLCFCFGLGFGVGTICVQELYKVVVGVV